ncbi:MAG TPA: class II aldolase/adducin family protein [Gemmatimonadaceae bacterium]|nr:class II aldolase/adducin family protein [Gemmatimonadaceae bacterium]
MSREAALRDEIVLVCRRLWERGLIAGPDGNVSARLDDSRLLITPAGLSKVDLRPNDLVIVDLLGGIVSGDLAPSSEIRMHLRAYARRADVHAVVHAHPPTATAFAVAGEELAAPVLPEVILLMGRVPLLPYAQPGTEAMADAFEPFLAEHDAFLLANHGATTLGPTLRLAHQRMESLEHAARIVLAARTLGRVSELTPQQVRALDLARDVARRAVPPRNTPGGSLENP